ncbi:MAG: integrase [Candidatus Thiosymbion ectosymbiont of Robbea hypermnestra]|nr:integrase [Candidatus Thiosymbion ectosymbiont of Robbea hypermnestra]
MITEMYEVFVSAGADDEKAKTAARALADYKSRFNRIDSDLRVLKWMVGAILAGVVSL